VTELTKSELTNPNSERKGVWGTREKESEKELEENYHGGEKSKTGKESNNGLIVRLTPGSTRRGKHPRD